MKRNEDLIKTIVERTCCRTFDVTKQVFDREVQKILRAAQAAPSAKNRQPWYFIVIRNQLLKEEIVRATNKAREKQFENWNEDEKRKMIEGRSYVNSNDRIILDAPVTILVIRDSDQQYQEAMSDRLNIKEEESVANAACSIMLAAWSLGIGSAWICSAMYVKEELRILLSRYGVDWNQNWEPRVFMPLGYPQGELVKPKRNKLSEISKFIY